MKAVQGSILVLTVALVCACGGDSSSSGTGGTTSSGGSSSGGTSSGGTSSGGTSSGGGGTSGTGGSASTTACGPTLVCDSASVCIVDEKSPTCTAKLDDAGSCPPGQTETLCGGIGYPCCCEPPPTPDYRCENAGSCVGKPDCSCLGNVCKGGQICMGVGGKDYEFHCSDPPVP